MSNPLLPDELQSRAQIRHRIDTADLPVGQAPEIDWQAGQGITLGVSKNPDRNSMIVNVTASGATSLFAGADNIGAGQATGAGDALSATVWTAVNLNRDYVVPAVSGDQLLCELDALVDAGTGIVYFDVMSVNSGSFAGGDGAAVSGGAVGVGWPTWQCPVTVVTAKSVTARITLGDTDIDPATSTATLRLMYRLSAAGGSPVILGNDTDGHYRFQVINRGPVAVTAGQNTGPPTVTPPASGTITVLSGPNALALVSSATATNVSTTFNATAGHQLLVVAQTYEANHTTQTITITDNVGDGAGATSWTAVSPLDYQATIGTGSGGVKAWVRVVGATPGTAKAVTLTRVAATESWNQSFEVYDLNGWSSTPTQSGGQTTGNVAAVTLSLTAPGSTDAVVTSLFNPSAAVAVSAAPTLPTTGTGTWVSDDDAIRNGDGHATAHQIGGVANSLNWTGLSPTSGEPIPALFWVFTPSGAATNPAGVETWDSAADTTANVNGDLGWVISTVSY